VIMKSESDKTGKQQKAIKGKTAQSVCGTLSYIAECRGPLRKPVSTRWAAPPDDVNKSVRK